MRSEILRRLLSSRSGFCWAQDRAWLPPFAAQEAPSPDGPPPASKAAPQLERQGDKTQTLKVNVNLVDVYFSARDKNGFVAGLSKDDCQLSEDNKPQTIKNLTQEKNLPLTIGILLDTSGSQTNVLPLEQDSGARFLKEVLTPKDEAFLISFDVNVDLLADYTNSPRELNRAIDKASIKRPAQAAASPASAAVRCRPAIRAARCCTTPSISPRMTSCSPDRAQGHRHADGRRRPGIAGDDRRTRLRPRRRRTSSCTRF